MRFEFKITPRGKGRPRFMRRGKFIQAFTDKATRQFESFISKEAKKQMSENKFEMMDGPLTVSMTFYMPRPKSLPKKSWFDYHTKKPDVDNIAKGVLDALNEIAWTDDSHISIISALKLYGDEPRIEMYIEQLPSSPRIATPS